MKTLKKITYLAVLTVLMLACKATVEGEQSKFDGVKNKISELSGTFPRYTAVITSYIETLDTKWEKALETSGDEQKIEALKKVNSSAKTGIIKSLLSLNETIKKAEDDIVFMERRNAAEVEIGVLSEIEKSKQAISEVKAKLLEGEVAESSKALIEVNGFASQIRNANRYVALAVKRLKKKDSAAKTTQEKAKKDSIASASASSSNTSTSTSTEEVKMIACKYCKTKNKSTNTKCSSCGASLK